MNIENNISLLSALMLFGGLQSLFLAILLLILRRKNILANRYLSIIVAGLGLMLLHQFLIDTNYIKFFPYLIGITMPLEFIYAPTLYLYVRTMTKPSLCSYKTKRHFLSVIIGTLLYIPFYILDFDSKMTFVVSNYFHIPDNIKISFPIAMLLSGTIFTIYLALSFKLLFSHTRNINQFFSYREKITLSWLRNLLLIMIGFWIFLAFFYYYLVTSQSIEQTGQLISWFFVFTIPAALYIGIMGLLQRRIYRSGSNSVTLNPQVNNTIKSDDIDIVKQNKYSHSALTKEISVRLLKRLTETMEQQKPYLDNNLTLPDLAELISTSPNYLSQVINQQLKMNFFDYVNSYRIRTAKELIINPLPHTNTILDIAMESAFNSKSAFYTAFKKQTGITPAQFKKSYM